MVGEHSKPARAKVRAALAWVLGHKRVMLSFVVGAVSAVSAVKPDFPGAVVVSVARAVLGG
ncbi:hypothetical protein [Streptomyces sp. NPDC008125]|uniref:hypothetical protein n=1 Tax=Streptomyces sp. NPDC008125 TaxID=3364811 RepID=UPI0036F0EC4B